MFAAVFVVLLTIGIAANVAVFSTIDALFLRPLPIERPDEVVRLASLKKDGRVGALPSTMLDVLKSSGVFRGVCGMDTRYMAMELAGNMRQLGMAAFSGECFHTLGIGLQLGRGIAPDDDHQNTGRVAVISDSLWREAYAGRPDVLGKAIRIEDSLYTIVGVTAKGFSGILVGFPEPVMIPLSQEPDLAFETGKSTYWWVNILGRCARGIPYPQASKRILAQSRLLLEQSLPAGYSAAERTEYLARKLTVVSARNGLDYFLRNRFGDSLYAVFGLCGAILLMTCVNLTSLLLARSFGRRSEVAVRLALGAKSGHIASIFILENAMLLGVGGVLGVAAGCGAAQVLLARAGTMFGNFNLEIGLDVRVLLFLGAVIALVFGVFPAASIWQAGHLGDAQTLKQNGRGVIARNTVLQKGLLAAQIALTLALVTSAALFGESIRNMYAIDLGIRPQNVWSIMLSPRPGGYRNFTPEPYYRGLLSDIEALPGVVSATISLDVPFYYAMYKTPIRAIDVKKAEPVIQVVVRPVGDGFFRTMGAKVEAGEDFRRGDDGSGELRVIVSRSLAERLGDPRSAIGHHLRMGGKAIYQRAKIIGVAVDMDLSLVDLNDKKPLTMYLDFWGDRELEQYPIVLVKTATNQLDQSAIRKILDRSGREYIQRFTAVTAEIDNALVENRLVAYLSGAFSVLALGIAAVGLFGLLSYQVSNRTAEIGVRMALGARRTQVQWLFMRQVLALVLVGSCAGLAAVFAVQKAIASLLYGASALDPLLLSGSVAVLLISAALAAWLPISRACNVDPAQALRQE